MELLVLDVPRDLLGAGREERLLALDDVEQIERGAWRIAIQAGELAERVRVDAIGLVIEDLEVRRDRLVGLLEHQLVDLGDPRQQRAHLGDRRAVGTCGATRRSSSWRPLLGRLIQALERGGLSAAGVGRS